MATWLYQLNQDDWHPNKYRLDIWEGEPWRWPSGKIVGGSRPQSGDQVIFCYLSNADDPGFYGWAVVLRFESEVKMDEDKKLYFRPVSPSDHLKMDPWWDDQECKKVLERIRGNVPFAGTLFPVPDDVALDIRRFIAAWLSRKGALQ